MDWLTIVVFCVVFHATGHLMSTVKAYQERRLLNDVLRDLREFENKFDESGKIKRVK